VAFDSLGHHPWLLQLVLRHLLRLDAQVRSPHLAFAQQDRCRNLPAGYDRTVYPASSAGSRITPCGDAFTAFGDSTNRVAAGSDLEALVAYFAARSPVSPPAGRRVVRLDP
jgi:hypothetical protein